MLAELRGVFDAVAPNAAREEYAHAIIEANVLGKSTAATRRATNQRLGELYGLDRRMPAFRVLRSLWVIDPEARPLLALLVAVFRDPLLAATASTVVGLRDGEELTKSPLTSALAAFVGPRMNPATLDKVVRNTASSWAQAGHVAGRTFKRRQRVKPSPATVALALYLGWAAGFRGQGLFTNAWVALLDCSPAQAQSLAQEAKRQGLIDLRIAGDVFEVNVDRLEQLRGV